MASNDLETFREYLVGLELSERTIQGYLTNLNVFTRWFEQTNEEGLTPHSLTPTDAREYKHFLLVVQKAKATTINRHLTALRAYANWAKTIGVITYNPVDGIKSIGQQSHAPKWLD
jgi:site-specific recombinase XerD